MSGGSGSSRSERRPHPRATSVRRPDGPLRRSGMLANICLGQLQSARGYFDAAVPAFETALEIYVEDDHRNYYQPLWWRLGFAYALAGPLGPEPLVKTAGR